MQLYQIFSEITRFYDGGVIYEYDNSSEPLGVGLYGIVFEGKYPQFTVNAFTDGWNFK